MLLNPKITNSSSKTLNCSSIIFLIYHLVVWSLILNHSSFGLISVAWLYSINPTSAGIQEVISYVLSLTLIRNAER